MLATPTGGALRPQGGPAGQAEIYPDTPDSSTGVCLRAVGSVLSTKGKKAFQLSRETGKPTWGVDQKHLCSVS